MDVKSTNSFILEVLFLRFNIFYTSFWKRVHNSKESGNLQDLFVLTVGYVDMSTYPLSEYYYVIKEAHRFFMCLLFINTFSFLLFLGAASWSHKRKYLHASVDILI